MKKMRLDDILVERGVFPNREAAKRAVIAHEVRVDDVYPTSAAVKVSPEAQIYVKDRMPYVSRGGYKLQGALDAFEQSVDGLRCCDIGSSTGGFSDCLLQAGAAQVTCVDVNYGELAWKVRSDPRVVVRERTNIRTATPEELGAPFDLLVADLSFIGLVKPQFESMHEETEGGLVTDESVRQRTVDEVVNALEDEGFQVTGCIESPIHGKKKGNIEYLVRAVMQ